MPNNGKMESPDRIILGSGNLYCVVFEGELPPNEEIEKDENLLSLIQGGASVEYKPSLYEAKDDMGKVSKVIMTEEEAILKSGLMTLNAQVFEKLSSTARVSTAGNKRVVKIGGASNQNGKKYLLHFHHIDKLDGDIRLRIVGQNQAGFTLAFAKDKETIVDAEFKAQPMDKEGTLIYYEEEIENEAAEPEDDE